MFIKSSYFVAAFLAARLDHRGVDAHGYLKTPRSRNYVASIDPVWYGGTATDPDPENCPHCLNIGGTEARCGKVGDHNYDLPPDAVGGTLAPAVQECYAKGAVIDIESVLTAHHKGHFEVKACPAAPGEAPTQACFDNHPLAFVEDVLYGAPADPLYPERAYIPLAENTLKEPNGNYIYHHRYQLPEGLKGDFILLQWYYVTANSCSVEGYDTYNFAPGFDPGTATCEFVAPDGRGLPEQFWNCAEVEIRVAGDCGKDSPPSPPTTASPTKDPTPLPTKAPTPDDGGAPRDPTTLPTKAPTPTNGDVPSNPPGCVAIPQDQLPEGSWATTDEQCAVCASGTVTWWPCSDDLCDCSNDSPAPPTSPAPPAPVNPAPSPTPLPPTSNFNYSADHGEDSRLIAYVGNWQNCPTDEQVAAYSHLVIAFAVSYTWSPGQNSCDAQCHLADTVPICGNQNRQDLVDGWRAKGKKVILSFGGAGMGGSWSGDSNNCWDYCFGKEDQLSTDLTSIIADQHFDGIDIDYEYCYDVAGKQSGKCPQHTNLYSDDKAQNFLSSLTSNLRTKLDALQANNGYDRGRYEVTHAPMDTDLVPDSQYFRILKDRHTDLDFLMPQFYNGVTRPGVDGVDGTGAGARSTAAMFSSLANDLFDREPNKVVFGFCISDCSGTGSNISSDKAVEVMFNLKAYNNDEFMCNGGAFFWVASHDNGWSNNLVQEVSLTAGCSVGSTPSPSTSQAGDSPSFSPTGSSTPIRVTSMPSLSPTKSPSSSSPTKSASAFPSAPPIDSPTYSPTGVSAPDGVSSAPSLTPSKRPSSATPTKPPTTNGCVAIPQDRLPAGSWATTDEQCGKCTSGDHHWWPCDADLCDCGGDAVPPAPPVPAPAPVDPAPVPNPNCQARSNSCSATNPCADGLCCSQWGYCGSAAGYCGDCCQSGNCLA